MRMTYEKPVMIAESFRLVEHISEGCALNTGTYTALQNNAWTCAIRDSGGTVIFVDGTDTKCTSQQLDPSLEGIDDIINAMIGGQCYNSVVNGPMFSS